MMAAAEAGGEEGGPGAAGEPGGHCPASARGPKPCGPATLLGSPAAFKPAPAETSRAPAPLPEEGGGGAPVPSAFPPLPPPPQPPLPAGGLSTVDEGDSLDGPEYEEEEVAIPLNAPPTNQNLVLLGI